MRFWGRALGVALVGVFYAHTALAADDWWNEEWQFRKSLAVDTSPTGTAIAQPLAEYPTLVRLHLGNFNYWGDVKQDGSDLRFVAGDDITPLPFHIEKFDAVNQIALLWVKTTQLVPGLNNQGFYLYYGNPDAVPGENAPQTFDKNTVAVLHFSQARPFADTTAYGNSPSLANAATEPAGLIGQAARFAGGQSLRFLGSPSLAVNPANGWTFSTWVRLDGPQVDAVLTEHADTLSGRLRIGINGTALVTERLAAGTDPSETGLQSPPSTLTLAPGTWHHVAYTISSAGVTVYLDGAVALTDSQPVSAYSGGVTVGSTVEAARGLAGATVDEIRISNVARPADWVTLAARSEGMNAVTVFYGEDAEQGGGETEGHFVTTLRNVDWSGLEGVVIFICVFMAIFSWYVMIDKALTIERIRGANRQFLDAYRDSQHVEEVDGNGENGERASERFKRSSIAEVYSMGLDEVRQRTDDGAVLTGEGVDAVRATLVAHNVRVSQRMNNLMVLLTLAIAGGPFLGLLGTVVGVMVTFAGIAASGDVNINAIAPGIAAALVATVAGLGVAIPALFGYNYISSRISEVITENNVFLEEFVAAVIERFQGRTVDAG